MMAASNYRQIAFVLVLVALGLVPVYLLFKAYADAPEMEPKQAEFVGKEACIECHQQAYNDWVGSHHDRSMDHATVSTVLGDFKDVTLEAQGKVHRFFKKENKFMVYTDGADGEMQEFEVKYVFGFTPLQQYLVEFPGGRLQTLALTWDDTNKQWYHMADQVYKDQSITHDNWLHWTNQAQNWNSMCADCHSTNLQKNYDPHSDTYNTTWSEINVSCEACHGPGSEHLRWAALADYAREDIPNYGLEVKTSGITNHEFVDNCVRCHSRRSSLQDFDHSTASIYDHVIPNLPEDPTWYIDGQIRDEDYVYASFLHSKMYMKDVKCSDCHNVHSGKLHFGTDYNRLCAQCHQSDIYDTPAHHFHKTAGMAGQGLVSESGVKFDVGSGALCINCHMHGQFYMGVDYRRDHSFRIPRPDLSMKYGVPNACNQCHADKSNQWSEDNITKWFGKSRRFHFAEAFSMARSENRAAVDPLSTILNDELYPPSIRALALQHLGTYFIDSLKNQIDGYLAHLDPTLRLAAVRANAIQGQDDIKRLLPMLTDETKAVRTEAARMLAALGDDQVPQQYKNAYQNALKEYEAILLYNADFPIGKFNLANFYYNQGKNSEAEGFYIKALKQDKELHFIKLNLAYCLNRLKKNDQAALAFKDYLKYEPNDAQAMYSYGLLLSEMQRYDESLTMLEASYKQDAQRPRVAHNIAMMHDFKGNKALAEDYLKKEITLMKDYNSQAELLRFYLTNQMNAKALPLARQLRADYPDVEELKQVLANLER